MQLLIPFAAPQSDAGRQALRALALPHLGRLLDRLQRVEGEAGDGLGPTPPHEAALARSLGWAGGAGRLPWAAWLAAADGLDPGDLAWGLVTPVHWHVGSDQVSLLDPALLQLDAAGSRAFFDAVHDLFAGRGWLLRWGAPLRWYAAHESLATLATASIDRVIGRNVDAWLGQDPAARGLRRLQAEVQMRLHEHPLNHAREARGALAVNSFWLSGCGVAQPARGTPPAVDERLRGPALAEDWPAWSAAWRGLDGGPVATLRAAVDAGHAVALTLCGERGWSRWEAPKGRLQGPLQRLRSLLAPANGPAVLEPL